jgi:hypothetical protein
MNIKNKFLELTSKTYPHGSESELYDMLCKIHGLRQDEFGNLFLKIGNSSVMFTSHLDTACSYSSPVGHVFEGNIIKTDGLTLLGADDKAGVTVMLYMIDKGVPGLYYFFIGEECGCVGSKKLANKFLTEPIEGIEKVISFDRRGTDSIITHQSSKRTASDEFAAELAKQLNLAEETFSYKGDDTGILTDSIQFISIYPECTNISVGYRNEHTVNETQDIEHLEKLAVACTKVDWESLPVKRDKDKIEYKSYKYDSWYDNVWDDYPYEYSGDWYGGVRGYSSPKNEKIWFEDEEFGYISYVEIDPFKKYVSVDLCDQRILKEKFIIQNLLISLDLKFQSIDWDGMHLQVNYKYAKSEVFINRNDLIEYLPEIDYKKLEFEFESGLTKDFK